MKPVRQRDDYDCFSACIASLTGIPLDKIPPFVENPEGYIEAAQRWLRRRGFVLSDTMELDSLDKRRNCIVASDWYLVDDPTYGTLFAAHAVVARNNKVVHDPGRSKPKKRYSLICGWELRRK